MDILGVVTSAHAAALRTFTNRVQHNALREQASPEPKQLDTHHTVLHPG